MNNVLYFKLSQNKKKLATSSHKTYINFCISLAKYGRGRVSPNPEVGCAIVADNRIIGHSYHKHFGGPHAEINALLSVKEKDKTLLPKSTIYISLEPCNHWGKTGPCTQAILDSGIPHVVFGCYDPNPLMSGKSVEFLQSQGIKVTGPVNETECLQSCKPFVVNQQDKRPYVILKWAESMDGFVSAKEQRTKISNTFSDILVHRWRSEVDAIVVGRKTFFTDLPELTTRLVPGKNPRPIVFSNHPEDRNLLNDTGKSKFSLSNDFSQGKIVNIRQLLQNIYAEGLGILLVEGGPKTIQTFINSQLWDEARVIRSPLLLHTGVAAPALKGKLSNKIKLSGDEINIIRPI